MSRRRKRRAPRRAEPDSRRLTAPSTDAPAEQQHAHPPGSRWLLAATALMVAIWIGFLAAMALWG